MTVRVLPLCFAIVCALWCAGILALDEPGGGVPCECLERTGGAP